EPVPKTKWVDGDLSPPALACPPAHRSVERVSPRDECRFSRRRPLGPGAGDPWGAAWSIFLPNSVNLRTNLNRSSVASNRAFDCNPLCLEIESDYSITKSPGSNAGPLVAPRPGLCSPQNLRLPLFRYRMGLSSAEIAKRESLDRDSRRQGL
ncbi:uncharacterized protein CCOS01_15438, partial [Colletotrichum costaricense]